MTLTAVPATGYLFTGWSGGLTGTTNPASITLYGNQTVTAGFTIQTFTISASAGANGTITPSGANIVNYGSNQTFTFTPSTGYAVSGVTVDGSPVAVANSYTFTSVTASHTISVTFAIQTFTITPTAGANGTISPSGVTTVNSSGSQAFTFTPSTGYAVSGVTVNGSPVAVANSYTFTSVTASHTISVTFAIQTFTITPTVGANGTINPSVVTTVNYGGSQTFTFTPSTGYSVSGVTVDGSPVTIASSYTFSNVTASHTIAVSFPTTPTTHPTSLTFNGATTGDYDDPAVVAAILTDTVTNLPVPGVNVTISIGSQSITDVTDATGEALGTIIPNVAAGTYPLTASFAGKFSISRRAQRAGHSQ